MSQVDVTKLKYQPDGQFRRGQSTFRNFIEKGGKFAPEKGKLTVKPSDTMTEGYHQVDIIFMFRMPV
jgi:hypothetical protein